MTLLYRLVTQSRALGASSALVVFEDLQPCPFNLEQKTPHGESTDPDSGVMVLKNGELRPALVA